MKVKELLQEQLIYIRRYNKLTEENYYYVFSNEEDAKDFLLFASANDDGRFDFEYISGDTELEEN